MLGHRLTFAPVSPTSNDGSHGPNTIIDVGCGTGVVTTYLGQMFPLAHVYGVDLSPPDISQHTGNVEWVKGDVRELAKTDARFGPASVDYVFHRLLMCGMRDWQGYVNTVVRMLKPGAWAEMQDLDVGIRDGTGNRIDEDQEWAKIQESAGVRLGVDLAAGSHMENYMQAAELENIQVRQFEWPLSERYATNVPAIMLRLFPRTSAAQGYKEHDISVLTEQMREDLAPAPGKHYRFTVTTGQKPTSG